MRTIVVNKHTPFAVETFSHLGRVIALDTPEVTARTVRNAEILVVRSETKVNRDLLEGSAVRFVGTVTIGTDHVDLEYLKAHNITFASAPGSNANAVAEYIASALLTWSARTQEELTGKTIGIVGVGNVGSKVAKVAKALGMEVLLNDPPLACKTGDKVYRPLDELMQADVITLHVPLTMSGNDRTYHLFDHARILRMKQGALLINSSRGAVVERGALREALAQGHLAGAILDVWEGEPAIDVGLLDLVALGTPHIAGHSLDGKLNALRMVYEAACGFADVSSQWQGEGAGEPPGLGRIVVPEEKAQVEDILRYAIRQTYDIELDDYLLRQIAAVPEPQRGAYFAKLRSEYRTRREFYHRHVDLSPGQTGALEALTQLGFKARVKEDVPWTP